MLDATDWSAQWIGWDGGEETNKPFTVLQAASWIWYPGGNATIGAPIGTRFFRGTVTIPARRRVRKAALLAIADDAFVAYVNGQSVGRGQSWAEVKLFDITRQLRPGVNTLAIAATNSAAPHVAPDKNPAGLIGLLKVEFDEGEPFLFPTDSHWRTSDTEIAGWEKDGFDDVEWKEPQQLGVLGIAPWGKIGGSNHRRLPARMLRHQFNVTKEVQRATAYICGLGFFDLHLNGQLVSDQLMNPALTGYDRRALYVTFDVTREIHSGDNAIGVVLGNGRYFAPRRDIPVPMRTYGFPKLLLQLRLEYSDGSIDNVVSGRRLAA